MSNKTDHVQKFFASLIVTGFLTSLSISAWAEPPSAQKMGPGGQPVTLENDWYFSCYPEKETSISTFPPPNILLVLDTSDSMNRTDIVRETRLRRAQNAIYYLLRTNEESVPHIAHFGFEEYHGNTATLLNSCEANNERKIANSISHQHPNSTTPTSKAVEVASQSSCHTSLQPGQASATAVITDGVPNYRGYTIEKTCDHRQKAPVYSIGLGPGTDKYFNDMMAAAGGTGTCYQRGAQWDPCDHKDLINREINRYGYGNLAYVSNFMSRYDITCSGSYSVNRSNELIAALLNIIAKVSCNFPLEAVGLDLSQLPEDPQNKYPWFKVQVHQSSGSDKKISYINDPNAEEGWTWKFVNSKKDAVALGSAACSAIKQRQVTSVKTTVGCICKYRDGEQCGSKEINNVEICPPGRYSCDRGLNECKITTTQNKPSTTLACNTTLTGVCASGHLECVNGNIACIPNNRPMPEVCDGLDNDCNGIEDDIETSWSNPKFQAELEQLKSLNKGLYNEYYIHACLAYNLCMCRTPAPLKVEVPMSTEDLSQQYSSYVKYSEEQRDYWDKQGGNCICQVPPTGGKVLE